MAFSASSSGFEIKTLPDARQAAKVIRKMGCRHVLIKGGEALERSQARIPLGRFARPEEVSAVALFLASEQASYVTGAIIPMDGGSTAVV